MDPKTLYWTAAWANMAVVVCLAGLGVRQAHHGRYEAHRRLMLTSASLIVAFVVSYALKLFFLGREALETWAVYHVTMLRIHELCVLAMLVGGGTALYQAWRMRLPISGDGVPGLEVSQVRRGISLHRRAGFTALVAACLGVLTALIVLQGMYTRS